MQLMVGMALWMTMQATAAEVVWLSPPSESDAAWVAENAGADGPPLTPIDLRSAATGIGPQDDAMYAALETTLREVRAYETRLDGELLIMRDLVQPLENITIVRDEADREQLFAALAYQGFAVNRFFGDALADDPQAAEYRAELEGRAVELPWIQAAAIEPGRAATAYEIAEAPQRIAFDQTAKMAQESLPASFTPLGLPPRARLFVDGREADVGASGNLKLTPGTHWIHVTLQDRVIARWTVTVSPAEVLEASIELLDEDWRGFLSGLADGAAVPASLVPHIEALGGEVWIARPREKRPETFRVSATGVQQVMLERSTATTDSSETVGVALGMTSGVAGSWFYSGDFYVQNPSADNHNKQTVNALGPVLYTGVDVGVGALLFSAGVDVTYTVGQGHVALTGNRAVRLRPYPHLAVGVPLAQATVGYLFPYHPGVGARVTLPIADPLHVRAHVLLGVPGTLQYDSGATYDTHSLVISGLGLGFRM